MRPFQQYSEFFWVFTWRNIRLQYSSFWLGIFWGIVQPLLMSAIFYIALNKSIGVDTPHYFIFIYSGFIFWSVFSGSLSQAYICFLQNDGMVKKIFFPRYLLPLTFLAAKLIDLLIALCILIAIFLISGFDIHPGWFLFYTLLGAAQLLLITAGFNLLFSVICVRFRGFQVVYPFVGQALFFTSSVIYDVSLSIEIEWLQPFFEYNPISIILATFRLGIFHEEVQAMSLLISTAYAVAIYLLGYAWFKRENKNLIDRL